MTLNKNIKVAVLVAALGYFVDVFDIVLFSIVRVASLKDLGLSGDELLSSGVLLLNMQLIGMLLGGIVWGVLGDKLGRIQVLFGSILLYSVANIANAFVDTVPFYALWRFLAGFGLAGEIGAGITLVSELMSKESRGIGTTVVATVGVMGAVFAAGVGEEFNWRTCYFVGGVMGLLLLLLRVSVNESGIFSSIVEEKEIVKGNFKLLFSSKERTLRYLSCVLIGLPIWFLVGILVTFSPEIGKALGVSDIVSSRSVFYSYIGFTLGDLASGLFSQLIKSRKKAIFIFILMTFLSCAVILLMPLESANSFYWLLIPAGFFGGYWAVFVTTASEQFGTNLRATVTTTAPNFVRGAAVLLTLSFNYLKPMVGVVASAQIVGTASCVVAFLALRMLKETFFVDLDFIEK
jgi:MFS transporter, putative metabolite:H+ symporter